MPDHACPSQADPERDPDGEPEVVAATSVDEAARLREMADISEFCQRSLMQLVSSGTKLAQLVADWAESDGVIELRQGRGATGFKGGLPATRAFAVASQAVRRSILLLQKVMHLEWWRDVPPPQVYAASRAEDGAARDADDPVEAGHREEAGDRAETLDRLDRVEGFAGGVAPGQVRQVIAGLREDIAQAEEMARAARFDAWDEEEPEDDSSSYAAKPQYPSDGSENSASIIRRPTPPH